MRPERYAMCFHRSFRMCISMKSTKSWASTRKALTQLCRTSAQATRLTLRRLVTWKAERQCDFLMARDLTYSCRFIYIKAVFSDQKLLSDISCARTLMAMTSQAAVTTAETPASPHLFHIPLLQKTPSQRLVFLVYALTVNPETLKSMVPNILHCATQDGIAESSSADVPSKP